MLGKRFQIGGKALDKALVLPYLFGEGFEQIVLKTELLALVVCLHQLQARHIHIQVHFLFYPVVSGAQRLDLRIGKGCFVHVLTGAHRGFGGHDLRDEFLLVFHGLP